MKESKLMQSPTVIVAIKNVKYKINYFSIRVKTITISICVKTTQIFTFDLKKIIRHFTRMYFVATTPALNDHHEDDGDVKEIYKKKSFLKDGPTSKVFLYYV